MDFHLRSLGIATLCVLVLGLSSCSSLKSWFTPEGKKFSQGRELLDQGHPLGATALAVEALILDPQYAEARELLVRNFAAGQQEFRTSTLRWSTSGDPGRFDHLVEVFRWQQTLAVNGPALGAVSAPGSAVTLEITVSPVAPELASASAAAAAWHWSRAKTLRSVRGGPRQARLALAEGRVAAGYSDELPGLALWLDQTAEAATQKLLVIPFFLEGSRDLGAVSGPVAAQVSRRLLEDPGLPELTTVFPSDRLASLPGGGPARLGLIAQPDALALAAAAGQNLVLLGQFTRADYQPPRKTVRIENRERTSVVVTPDHPEGIPKVWKAAVTYTRWITTIFLEVSFTVVEVDTGRDLVTAVRESRSDSEATTATFVGDREALTSDDLAAVDGQAVLVEPNELKAKVVASLGAAVATVVRQTLN